MAHHRIAATVMLTLLIIFLGGGCGTLPKRLEPALPQVTGFPPVAPSLVRLPVEVVFPSGGDLLHHLSNLIKGGFKQLMPDLRGLPGLYMDSHISDFWKQMQEPIFLDKDTWLLIRPRTLGIGMVRTDLKRPSTVHTVLEMTAGPEIVFGPEPRVTPGKMPPLQPFEPGPGIFQAMSNTRISYEEANQYFKDPRMKLIGVVFPGSGDRRITLESFRFSGAGGQVRIEVKLHYNPILINLGGKPADLTLYLRGTPRYQPKERVFDFPDLDYEIQSSDLVVEIADWLNKSGFTAQLRRSVKLPMGPKMDAFKDRMNVVLNRPLSAFTRLRTKVNSFKVMGGFADDQGIEVRLSVEGAAVLEVTWN